MFFLKFVFKTFTYFDCFGKCEDAFQIWGEIMKSNSFARFSVLLCVLFAVAPMVSAADDGEVFVVAVDDVGISNYMKSLGDGTFEEQVPLGQVSGFSYGNGLGDFDKDGDLDYITATGSASGSVYLFEKLGPSNDFADPVVIGAWRSVV